jgi:hypothetical protein
MIPPQITTSESPGLRPPPFEGGTLRLLLCKGGAEERGGGFFQLKSPFLKVLTSWWYTAGESENKK